MIRPAALLALIASQVATAAAQGPKTPYWQQEMSYDITARLDEMNGVLSGTETIRYTNNSPDTLTRFSLHLYPNAFRPGSRWAERDALEGRIRFNNLKDPDFAYNHVSNVTIMGQKVEAQYPLAPDSTIVRFTLPRPLAPGESMTVTMDWDARPSTLPRRQGRDGRRFDFAQWYPRVVTYDRYGWQEHALYPAGEFYGEFATFTVDLNVPEDQVLGFTGIAVCGDPGWERANRNPDRPVNYQRDWYGELTPECPDWSTEPGRKKLRLYARDVHHFAISLNPDYRYEGGEWDGTAIHVLYQPGDEESWGSGVAVERTRTALEWLDKTFGEYPWPQITNVHRIEGGGTEFPMMIMDGSASLGLIVHELGHNYVMGILANNEWKEGYLDEGFTSFQSTLFFQEHGEGDAGVAGLENFILGLDLGEYSQPVSMVSEDYRDYRTYSLMIYAKGELFYHQLRYIVGDSVMSEILREYYDRWKLKHVDTKALLSVAEEVSGMDLGTFFAQWLHNTVLYDYAVGDVESEKLDEGRWRTRVEVLRLADGQIPVEVAVIADGDTTVVRSKGRAEHEWVEVITPQEPDEVVIDPWVKAHDWNMLNNRKKDVFLFGWKRAPHKDHYIDRVFSERQHRDQLALGYIPTVWYNDQGGVTLGIRTRMNYLGRYEQNLLQVSRTTGWGTDKDPGDWNWRLRWKNPVFLRAPRASQELQVFDFEGRRGASLMWEQMEITGFVEQPVGHGASLQWVDVYDMGYLDAGFYQDAGTVEGQVWMLAAPHEYGSWMLSGKLSLGGGVQYLNQGPGISTDDRYDVAPYFRGHLELEAGRPVGGGVNMRLRGFAGIAEGGTDVVRQRRFFLSRGNPYEQLFNPFIRSRGAPLASDDVNYHVPGGGNLRGFAPRISAEQIYAVNAELSREVWSRDGNLFNSVSVAAFGGAALANGDINLGAGNDDLDIVGNAGIGLRIGHQIGDTRFVTRFDLPLYVSRPAFAQDLGSGTDEVEFRWTFSFEPAW